MVNNLVIMTTDENVCDFSLYYIPIHVTVVEYIWMENFKRLSRVDKTYIHTDIFTTNHVRGPTRLHLGPHPLQPCHQWIIINF